MREPSTQRVAAGIDTEGEMETQAFERMPFQPQDQAYFLRGVINERTNKFF